MTTSHRLDFRSLDAADSTLTLGQQQRADALLERIVATPVTPESAARASAPRQKRLSRKVIWLPAAAAAVAVGGIVFPGFGGSGTAYASWTATPSAVAARDLEAVTQACRAQFVGYTRDGRPVFDAASIPVALAERRGDFVAVLFYQDNPETSASCVATNHPGSTDVDNLDAGIGGSSGPAMTPPAGRITQGAISQFAEQPPASITDGAVGANVVGVTIHAGNRVVMATVKNGRYAAWWPGKAFADGPQQPSGKGGPEVILTYDVTLADGTIKTNVDPARPE